MEEVKEKKKSNSVLVWILVIIVIGLVGYIVYTDFVRPSLLKDNEVGEKEESNEGENQENIVGNDVRSSVPVEDTYAFHVHTMWNNKLEIDYYLLNDGKLYYKTLSDVDQYYGTYDFYGDEMNKDLVEFEGLTNIKRIKGVNTLSTGMAFNVLLITEDGKVYEYMPNTKKVVVNEYLKEYKIDDMIHYGKVNGCAGDGTTPIVTCGGSYKFTTLDGKTYDVTLNMDGTITEN